jgi:phospholipid-binding lipoprotein MlaA
MRPLIAIALLSLCPIVLPGCATTGNNVDPWEGLNRKTFAFNDAVDRAVLKPVAQGYVNVTNPWVRARVSAFFDNIYDINTALNNFLQGKAPEAIDDVGRIVVNTTLGAFGLFDVATTLGVEKHDEDFGQTLGWWGVPPGPYFVIPLLGPSTARDAPARLVDPGWYYPRWVNNDTLYWSFWTLDKVRLRAQLFQAESVLEQAALDRYLFIRDAWLQRRRNQVYDGKPPLEEDFDEPPAEAKPQEKK